MTIRIGIAGAAGRMGITLIQAAHATDYTVLSFAMEQRGSDSIGSDAGNLAGVGTLEVIVSDTLNPKKFDVLIDFTAPKATLAHLETCAQHDKPMVIGTTGFSAEQRNHIQKIADEGLPTVLAPNMSVGVNLCLSLIENAAKTLGDTADIEIIEAHHRNKVDAPSGTALKMGEVIANALGRDLDNDGVFTRHGHTGKRDAKSIGFATIRGGDIVGDHTVLFATSGERIEITHRSSSRMTYAMGAMRAAKWILDRPSGVYDMRDVLGL